MGYSLPDTSAHGIFQARILDMLRFPTPGDLPDPGIKPTSFVSPALAGEFFTAETPGKPTNFIRAHIFNLSKFITLSQCLDFCLTWIFIE